MPVAANRTEAPIAIRVDLAAIFVSLELGRSKWLITSLSPGAGEKMSKAVVAGGDVPALLARFAELQRKAQARTGQGFRIVSIQEAGLDGFWIHRILEREGLESYGVDPASIATSRRRRRAKTDKIDGEALVRALLAYKRGEPLLPPRSKRGRPPVWDYRQIVEALLYLLRGGLPWRMLPPGLFPPMTTVQHYFYRWSAMGLAGRNRRLAKDFERTTESATAWLYLASIQQITRRNASL